MKMTSGLTEYWVPLPDQLTERPHYPLPSHHVRQTRPATNNKHNNITEYSDQEKLLENKIARALNVDL